MEGNHCYTDKSVSLTAPAAPRRMGMIARGTAVGFAVSAALAGGLGFLPETSAQEVSSVPEPGVGIVTETTSSETSPLETSDSEPATDTELPKPMSEPPSGSAPETPRPLEDEGESLPDGDEDDLASGDQPVGATSKAATDQGTSAVRSSSGQALSRDKGPSPKSRLNGAERLPLQSTPSATPKNPDIQVQADQAPHSNEAYPYAGASAGSRGSVQFEGGGGLGATAATVAMTLIAGSALLSLRRFL